MLEDVDPPEVSMVRVLIVLAIAIPIAIEVVTFGGLIGHYLGGGGAGPAATPTATAETGGATVDDEILTATAATERVDAATLTEADNGTRFVLTVTVTDPVDGYELRLGAVTTRSGRTIEGSGATTGRLDAGEDGLVTGTWQLPDGDRPDTLAVTVVSAPGNDTPTPREYTVDFGDLDT
ncbi:hypothetical protein [Haloarcula salinisoli]|uniref:Uncharacterized protein n=1 Tax=Haloarcula salinisoli TaxID=2487746 RepID=A0A8J7YHV0_9EURY|nr:hypothetical protein [Halomicroarcula salinisoli]MBX0286331.1 hypothetical protein [Halomicroarcula salinisoli]MBX0302181.1 hypothetical protein [Halomicroarcula salinisoli]